MVSSNQATRTVRGVAPAEFAGCVDLGLGSWRARDAARQIAEQLGLPEDRFQLRIDQQGDIIAQGVENEAAGPLSVRDAFEDARWIASNLPEGARVLALAPRFDPADARDIPFLTFLARFGVDLTWGDDADLCLPNPCPPQLLSANQQALLAFFPGPLPQALIRKAGLHNHPAAFADMSRGIVHPAFRDLDPAKSSGRIAALAPYLDADPRVALIYHLYGPPFYADADRLTTMGLDLCQQGEFDCGAALLTRAAAIAHTAIAGASNTLHLQGHRIYAHRFADAATQTLPAGDLPQDLADNFVLTNAWGKIFSGQPEAGLALLEDRVKAILQVPQASTNALFVLNIAALGCLRSGDVDRAYDLEKEIEKRLEQGGNPDARAVFINAINLARLHKRRNQPQAYGDCLSRAFETTDGLRNHSEMLQMNLMRAAFGATQPQAATYALRAALIWLALDPPETISIRAQQTLTFKPLTFAQMERELSALMAERLAAHWPMADPNGPAHEITAIRSQRVPPNSIALGHRDICLIAAPATRPASFASAERQNLAAMVFSISRDLFPGIDNAGPHRVLLNFDTGRDLPAGMAGLRAMMLRCDIGTGTWQGQTVTRPLAPVSHEVTLALATGVSSFAPLVVSFRRSLAPVQLTTTQADLVARLIDGPVTLDRLANALGHPDAQVLQHCRDLENDHIVRIEVADA